MQISWGTIIRFIIIILLQGLIFRRIHIGGAHFNYIAILFYPVLVLLLPMKMSRTVLLLVGAALGLCVDLFYESLGVHMSACVFIAFLRPLVLNILEPRGGYPVNASPTARDFGMVWFMQYAGILLFLFLLFYFAMEVFALSHFFEILLKTLSSFVVSFLAILLYIAIFNPKE